MSSLSSLHRLGPALLAVSSLVHPPLAGAARPQEATLVGSWEGAAVARAQELPVRVQVSAADAGLRAALDLRTVGVLGWPMDRVEFDAPAVLFVFSSDDGENRFEGALESGQISGTLRMVGLPDAQLRLHRADAPAARYRTEDVEVRNGDVILRGDLTLPPGPGPHPAIVFAHGSGNLTRDAYRFKAAHHAELGVATLALSGSWHARRSRARAAQ